MEWFTLGNTAKTSGVTVTDDACQQEVGERIAECSVQDIEEWTALTAKPVDSGLC